MRTKIVLINGKKRSGKDFFANELQQALSENGATSELMSFAGPIKEILSKSFEIPVEVIDECKNYPDYYPIDIYTPEGCELTSFRKLLQRFGTDAMKEWFGEDVWTKLLMERAEKSDKDFVLVPDFRFLCENVSDYTIKIRNDDVEPNDPHRSETELEDNNFIFRYHVNNTGHPDLFEDAQRIAGTLVRSL